MILLGIGGYYGAGKDEVADELVRAFGFEKTFMSKVLSEALLKLNPWIWNPQDPNGEQFDAVFYPQRYSDVVAWAGYTEAKKNPEVRRLLQMLGTEVGRNLLGEDTWVNAVAKDIRRIEAQGKSTVVTGIRYVNELEMIHRLGGMTVWVRRPGFEPSGTTAEHSSERTLAEEHFDIVVNNVGTLEDLYAEVASLHDTLEKVRNNG